MTAHHIALVLHDFSTGGSERIAIRLANAWHASGRNVSIFCGTQQGPVRNLVAPGIHVEACTPETTRNPWSRFLLGVRLTALVRQHRPDIIFSPGNFHLVVLAILGRQAFPARRPRFVTKLSNPMGGGTAMIDRLAAPIYWMMRQAAAPINAMVAMSPALAHEARDVFPAHDIVEISEPILEDVDKAYDRSPQIDRTPLILCAGRLWPQKDFITAIQSFALIADQTNANLLILGEGPMRQKLEREVARLGLQARVEMPGFVPDTAPYMARADLYLMTSRFEGYPAVLIEAMAAGLRIVTTNCSPAIAEIMVSPKLGCVTASRTPQDIAAAILAQLGQPLPDNNISASITGTHRIGQSASAYLQLFDRLTA
jgi:glycosyltransferase involved in cell wall biosynthesis